MQKNTCQKTKRKRFYYFLLKDDKRIGVLRAPKGTDTLFGREVKPIQVQEGTYFTLPTGFFAPYMNSNVCATFVNAKFKTLIEEFIPQDYPLEFIPMMIHSEEFGNMEYYIVHFTKVFDVIDVEHSKKTSTGDITVPVICYENAKDLDFFNSIARSEGIIVSDKFKREMVKRELDAGIKFWEWKSL